MLLALEAQFNSICTVRICHDRNDLGKYMRVRTTVCFNKQASRLSSGREPAYQCDRLEDIGSIPQSERSLEGLGHPLPSGLENPMNREYPGGQGSHRVRHD